MRSGESPTTQFHRRLVCEFESEKGIKLKSSTCGLTPGRDRKNSYKQNSANQPGDSISRWDFSMPVLPWEAWGYPTALFRLCSEQF